MYAQVGHHQQDADQRQPSPIRMSMPARPGAAILVRCPALSPISRHNIARGSATPPPGARQDARFETGIVLLRRSVGGGVLLRLTPDHLTGRLRRRLRSLLKAKLAGNRSPLMALVSAR